MTLPTAVFEITIGNVLTFLGVMIAFLTLRAEVHKQRRIERAAQQLRHEENLRALSAIREEIASLKHLDDCMDEVKGEIGKLRESIDRKQDKNEPWRRR